jgi:hypothetical protein
MVVAGAHWSRPREQCSPRVRERHVLTLDLDAVGPFVDEAARLVEDDRCEVQNPAQM